MHFPLETPLSGRPSRRAVLITAATCESRLLLKDTGWWVALALMAACVAYAGHNGRVRLQERGRIVAQAIQDESRRIDALTKLLDKIERHEAPRPDAPYRDPGNAIYVGRGQGAAVAYLPDAPLAAAAIGMSDLYPQVLKVSVGGKDSFLFVDEIENPAHLLGGGFDLAFVIVSILPLLVLGTCHDVLSGERERGTLALILSSSAPLATVLTGKLLVRAGGLAAMATIASCLFLPIRWESAAFAMSGLVATIMLTSAFWAALCLFVNAAGRDSAFNAVALLMIWVVLLVVGPAALNAIAQVLFPAPSRAELVIAVREAAVDAERDRDATDARYRAEHPETADKPGDDRTARTLAVTVAADARADAILNDQDGLVRRQRELSDRLAYLMPACLLQDALAELAGNGQTRWDDYLSRVATFHAAFRHFFVAKANARESLTTADYGRFPRFDPKVESEAALRASLGRVVQSLSAVALVTLALSLAAVRRLSRSA